VYYEPAHAQSTFLIIYLGTILEQKADNAGKTSLSSETVMALVKKLQSGNLSALMILYDRTSPLIFGLIMRVLGDKALAEETLLDVYTQVWKQSARYDPCISPLHWLTTLAYTNAMARLHLGKRETVKQVPVRGDSVLAMTVSPDLQKLARSSLESIPTAQRELLEQAYYRGLCSSEIAAQIGKPVGAVRALLRLGLGRIGESFGIATGG
jgi:RNA polymerase sigma-70 factor (ECF subfamily)